MHSPRPKPKSGYGDFTLRRALHDSLVRLNHRLKRQVIRLKIIRNRHETLIDRIGQSSNPDRQRNRLKKRLYARTHRGVGEYISGGDPSPLVRLGIPTNSRR